MSEERHPKIDERALALNLCERLENLAEADGDNLELALIQSLTLLIRKRFPKSSVVEYADEPGREAEELRRGIEHLIDRSGDDSVPTQELTTLLDQVDARDSLTYLEATR